jgi:YHS domain-containing protein
MQTERPARLIDPVCGMTVDVAAAEAAGNLLESDGRTYAFCRAGCKRAFVEDPAPYVAAAEAADAAPAPHGHDADGGHGTGAALPVIDEGFRRWYESCACCLSDAYPDIKAALDAERAAKAQAPVDPGICEVAEAEMAAPAAAPAAH